MDIKNLKIGQRVLVQARDHHIEGHAIILNLYPEACAVRVVMVDEEEGAGDILVRAREIIKDLSLFQ